MARLANPKITMKEAAKVLDVSQDTVRELIGVGKLQFRQNKEGVPYFLYQEIMDLLTSELTLRR